MTSETEKRFTDLYDRYAGKVFAYFAVGFGRISADDLTQQTFLNLWRHMKKHADEPESWRAWIFHIARNVRNDYLRAQKRRPDIVPYEDAIGADEPLHSSVDPEVGLSVRMAFSMLCEEEQDMLFYKSIGLNSREIGAILLLSSSAVRSRMQQARAHFRAALADRGVTVDD